MFVVSLNSENNVRFDVEKLTVVSKWRSNNFLLVESTDDHKKVLITDFYTNWTKVVVVRVKRLLILTFEK